MALPRAVAGIFHAAWAQPQENDAVKAAVHGRKLLCIGGRSDFCNGEWRATLAIAIVAVAAVFGALFVYLLCRLCWCCCFREQRGDEDDKALEEGGEVAVQPTRQECLNLVYNDTPKEQSLLDVKIESILGRGQFGKVYKGVLHGAGVAVKMIQHEPSALEKHEPLEALLSRDVDHPNVVKTYWYQTTKHQENPQECLLSPSDFLSGRSRSMGTPRVDHWPSARHACGLSEIDFFGYLSPTMKANTRNGEITYRTWIVMEFCDRGSLYNAITDGMFLIDKRTQIPRFSSALCAALDIAKALDYLHGSGIIHGDLKPQNVLLQSSRADSRGFYCKIGDFGLSRVAPDDSCLRTFTCGTVRYMPPELLKDGVLTPAADVYSFGMVLWELLTGQRPFPQASQKDIIMDVVDGKRPVLPQQFPADVCRLIQDCWHSDYRKRPTSRQLVERVNFLRVVYTPAARFPCKNFRVEENAEAGALRPDGGLLSGFRTNSFGTNSSQSSNSSKALLHDCPVAGYGGGEHRWKQ